LTRAFSPDDERTKALIESLKGLGLIKLNHATYWANDQGHARLQQQIIEAEGKQVIVLEPWFNRIEEPKTDDISKMLDGRLVVAFAGFVVGTNAVNLVPDYEALGESLGQQIKDFGVNLASLTSNENFTPTSKIMITAARKKVELKEVGDLGPKQAASQTHNLQKEVFIYPRRTGKVDGQFLEDAYGPDIDETLKQAGANRFMFVSLGTDGVIIKRIENVGAPSIEKRYGPVQGPGYWQPAIGAVLWRILGKEDNNPSPIAIKSLDSANHPRIAEFLKERVGDKVGPQL
jgi:hypothetical protein